MSPITTHILDVAAGRPARGVPVSLERRSKDGAWSPLGRGKTNTDGRVADLLADGHALKKGVYRLTFDTGSYFKSRSIAGFYPEACVVFEIRDTKEHYHVPLLLSPFGYSTYRGS